MQCQNAGSRPLSASPPCRLALALALALVVAGACGGSADSADSADSEGTLDAAKSTAVGAPLNPAPDLGTRPLGAGRVIWESNALGSARIFGRRLDGLAAEVLSREEPQREHCCAHFSPDGRYFVYLSLPQADSHYPLTGAEGELRLHELASGAERVLASRARTYFEHRAVVFRDADHLVYIDEQGRSQELRISSGQKRVLVEGPLSEHGWLLDPQLAYATQGTPTFSPYDPSTRQVLNRPTLGGCQPYFTADGRFGFYVAGAGGPIRSLELLSRKTREILRKGDRRLPADRRYLYFPMISHDRTLLVWGASDGGHDHFASNYDIFLAEIDPATLQLAGPPLSVSRDSAAERFPDVWAPAGARPPRIAIAAEEAAAEETAEAAGMESAAAIPGQVLLFRGGDYTNLVFDPASGQEVSTLFEAQGHAFYDRSFAFDLRGGSFLADLGTMQRLLQGVRATNEISLELVFESASAGTERAVLFTFSGGQGAGRNFTLSQERGRLFLQLLTESNSREKGNTPRLDLGPVRLGAKQLLLFTYAPGELAFFLEGQEVLRSEVWREGFFDWKALPLLFGNEWQGNEAFRGKILGATVWDRVLLPEEALARHRSWREELAARQELPLLRVRARLLARSRTPRLEDIAPYQDALAVYEYQLNSVLEGNLPPGSDGNALRVVHRVLAGGEQLPIAGLALGQEVELGLEPFAQQPQLESLFLSSELGEGRSPLLFSPRIDLR